ncbi:hypothetical protein MMC29_005629 [Sticta canariensis]|nr:hypothetical protein [Sticta canariensis]
MQQGKGWSQEVLALPNCGPQVTEEGLLIWYGPRVRMGMCEGSPTSVMPHTTSGRADYFGPFVNRAARYGNAAARGGQIMVPIVVAQALVEEWTGHDLPTEAGPVVMRPPDFDPIPVDNPLPQYNPDIEPNSSPSSISSKTAQQWSSKLRNSTAAKAASKILARTTSKGQYMLRLATELEPAGSTEMMLSAEERESRSCPEFQMTAMNPTFQQDGLFDAEDSPSPRVSLTARDALAVARLRSDTGLGLAYRESKANHQLPEALGIQDVARLRHSLGRRPHLHFSPPGSRVDSTRASSEVDSRDQLPLRYIRKNSSLSTHNAAIADGLTSDFQEVRISKRIMAAVAACMHHKRLHACKSALMAAEKPGISLSVSLLPYCSSYQRNHTFQVLFKSTLRSKAAPSHSNPSRLLLTSHSCMPMCTSKLAAINSRHAL